MRVFVLGSGSSGNCIIVESGGARVVLDAGLNPTAATRQLRTLGADLFPLGAASPLGIFVTHHHGDHIAQVLPLARALKAPVYMHEGISAARVRSRLEVRPYGPGEAIRVGPFVIDSLWLPHDAPQVALRVTAGSCRFGLATDLGHVRRDLVDFLGACDVALIESNHCPMMLQDGPYPPRLKERVRGPLGHLANEQTAELARKLVGRRVARLMLGHISRANNSPARALAVVAEACPSLGVEVIPNGHPRAFDIDPPRAHSRCFAQLELPF